MISQERALELGVTGPLLRATGHPWDLRKAMPYSSTSSSTSRCRSATTATTTTASRCAWTRCASRSRSSSRRSTGCPRAPYITDDRKVALPPRHELATSMEALIHHFKLVTEGFRVPPGEAYVAIESPRGELGCYVLADGSAKPARVHMRDPSFVNLQSLPEMAQRLADRRLHRLRGDARPDHRRGGPVSDASARAVARGTAAARLGRGRAARRGPGDDPGPRRPSTSRPSCAPRSRRYMAKYPDRHSATLPALDAAQRVHGWCSPEAIAPGGRGDAGDARLPVERRHLLRHAAHPSGRAPLRLRLHQRRLPPAQRQGRLRGDPRRRPASRGSRTSSCASSSAWAPATWRRWRRSTAATSAR